MKKIISAFLLACLILPFCGLNTVFAAKNGGSIELFLEALDSQGWQLYLLTNTVSSRVDKAKLTVYPLVKKDSNGNFTAKNGTQELEEARRIAIIGAEYKNRLRDYLSARVFDMTNEGWKNAAVFAGINPDTLAKKVIDGGDKVLEQAYARATVLNADTSSVYIDGKSYDGSLRLTSIFNAINSSLPESRRIPLPKGYIPPAKKEIPALYAVLPEGVKKNDQLVRIFDRWFEGIKADVKQYESVKEKFPWLEFLPSYILPATEDVKAVLGDFVSTGEFKSVEGKNGETGWIIYEDRNGNGYYPNKPERENTLELYIMSQCPYGVSAGNLLYGAQKAGKLPKDYKLELHFIGNASKNDKGIWQFSSLHGEAEWKENARQLYISKHYPNKIGAYILERNKDIMSANWQKAAKAVGLDVKAIEKGNAEALELLAADFALSDELGIGSSPSFIANGRSFFVGTSGIYKLKGLEGLADSITNSAPAGSCN